MGMSNKNKGIYSYHKIHLSQVRIPQIEGITFQELVSLFEQEFVSMQSNDYLEKLPQYVPLNLPNQTIKSLYWQDFAIISILPYNVLIQKEFEGNRSFTLQRIRVRHSQCKLPDA